MLIRRMILLMAGAMLMSSAAFSKAPKVDEGVALTVYNDNFAVVKERRMMDFTGGVNTMRFTDVATQIDPTSVYFECLSSPGRISVLEQNYEYDLVNTDSLLKRYLDKKVEVLIKGSGSDVGTRVSGILSASMGGELILWDKDTNQMEIIGRNSIERIVLKERPDDLVTKPTLVWLVNAARGGGELCEVSYMTDGIGWKADYAAVLNDDDDSLSLRGWVTIDNKSGAAYENATLKLVAGDVRRVREVPEYQLRRKMMSVQEDMAMGAGFAEKSFMEYHLYTLGRKSTIGNRQVKQIELIEPVENVAVEKQFVYEWFKKHDKVQVKLEFENTEENGLGIALPAGKVRAFKEDPVDGSLEFVGEDTIDHTPKKEELSLYIGDAFDIAVEHKVTDSKVERRSRTETHEVELRNRKDEEVTVFVDHNFRPWSNREVNRSNFGYEKRDADTIRFEVEVPADSTETLTFTVTERWEF